VIIPDRIEGDVEEIPEHERGDLEFVPVDEIGKALATAMPQRSGAKAKA
jgi:ATP-dependent Lon protease